MSVYWEKRSMSEWRHAAQTHVVQGHLCTEIPPPNVLDQVVARLGVIRSPGWSPLSGMSVLQKRPQRAPSPSSTGEHGEKVLSINQNLLHLDLGPPASGTMGNKCLLFISLFISYSVTAASPQKLAGAPF